MLINNITLGLSCNSKLKSIITSIEINQENKQLTFNHLECSQEILYDIYTNYGQIKIFAHLDKGTQTLIDVKRLSPGGYFVQIIFQGEIYRNRFNLRA